MNNQNNQTNFEEIQLKKRMTTYDNIDEINEKFNQINI